MTPPMASSLREVHFLKHQPLLPAMRGEPATMRVVTYGKPQILNLTTCGL